MLTLKKFLSFLGDYALFMQTELSADIDSPLNSQTQRKSAAFGIHVSSNLLQVC